MSRDAARSRNDTDAYLAASSQRLTGALRDLCEVIRGADPRIEG